MIKKLFLMIIILLGLTACMPKSLVVETTKDIELNEYIELGNYNLKTIEDIAAFLVTITEIENNNPVTISEVKNSFDWSGEKSGKDSYIVSAKYRSTTFKIPVKVSDLEVYANPGESYIEKNGMTYALGSVLPLLLLEVYGNSKYQNYLR